MSPGRHSRQSDDEIPSFSGDVPEDIALVGKVVRRRFATTYARPAAGFGAAFTLILAYLVVVGSAAAAFGVKHDHQLPAVIVLTSVALVAGVTSLVRLPGPVRFLLGGLPAALLMAAAMIADVNHDPTFQYLPAVLGVAALVTGAIHVFLAGSRFSAHFRRRLAEIDARQTSGRGSSRMS